LLAGATVGSFTGGALADKFGRTRTFQLDAIPLTIGAVLWFALYLLYFGLLIFNTLAKAMFHVVL
jgi:MFS family permease